MSVNTRSLRKFRSDVCLNCHHPLDISEKFCSSCGQLNSTKKLSFNDFFNELFSGILAYDSKFRTTLATLLFYPGKISKDYIQGKRIRYVNPFKFYLSASIVFFLIWSLTNSFEDFFETDINPISINTSVSGNNEEIKLIDLDSINNSNIPSTTTLDNTSPLYLKNYKSQLELDRAGKIKSLEPHFLLYSNFYESTNIQEPQIAIDSLNHRASKYNHWLYKKATDIEFLEKNPNVFWEYLMSKMPFIIFFYLPIFALFIWLLYCRRPFNYMEHLIFTFHVQTKFFILLSITYLLDFIFDTSLFLVLAMFYFSYYLYKALRYFYNQGKFKTLVKFIILNGIFLTLAIIAASISIIISFAIY